MPILRSILFLLVALPICRSAAAQERPLAGYGALTGVVRDSASGAPVPGVGIGVGAIGPTWADSSGRYTADARPGTQPLRVWCPSNTWHAQLLFADTVEIRADSVARLDLRVDRRACSEPAPDSIHVELAGHYSSGFEESSFVPCPGEVERAWGRALFGESRIWVGFAPNARARRTSPSAWPTPEAVGRSHRLFVRWRGLLAGPGMHGHLGASAYRFHVERILEVRTPAPGDCG